MNMGDELRKLQELHQSGALSNEEFTKAKAQILEGAAGGDATRPPPSYASIDNRDRDTRAWAVALHLSQFAGYLVPFAGLVVPIVLWQVKKNDLPEIDEHGKVVVNWIISFIIYAIISGILVLVLIGIVLLIVLGILGIVFPIIGAIKANEGVVWNYPMSIRFFK
jgi:uncharacterized Tic20 family protein